MLPLLQQRQMQQKQNSMQFQTYISQMQALNSMLHTLSYGTPLSELNKLHSGVKNQFESYNNEVSGRLKGVINQVKDMNKATELEKERLLHQLNDEEMRSEDEDEEFKDELDKLEERVEAQHRAKATTNQAVSVGAAPELSASSRQKTNLPLQQAGAMSQMPFYSQQQQPAYNPYAQSMAYPQMPGLNPYMASQVYPPYGYELKYDSSKSSSSRRDARQEKKPKKARDNSSSESKKKKKKTKKADYESDSKVSALDSPREVGSKEKKTKPDPMSMLFPSMPNMENMDPMMKNMMLMNMLSTMNQGESKKKKKRKGHKRDREEVAAYYLGL